MFIRSFLGVAIEGVQLGRIYYGEEETIREM
jgi:hypothetical protein